MSVPAKRHHLPRPVRIAGTVAAAVAASLFVVPVAHAAAAPAPALPAITREAPAEAEVVVSVQDSEMVYGATGELVASVETVDGDPVTSGTVTFLLNGRTLAADVVEGSATVAVTTEDFGSVHGYPLNHGGYWFRASFTGEGYTDADASAKLQVGKAPVQLDASLSAEELEAGDTVTLDGRVAALEGNDGQPQGRLRVFVDGVPAGDPVRVAEDGTFSTDVTIPQDWEPGEHTIGVQYDESANFTEGQRELELTVVAPDDGPGAISDALERMLRELLDWLGSLFGGR